MQDEAQGLNEVVETLLEFSVKKYLHMLRSNRWG
jgi:hypothetical protein